MSSKIKNGIILLAVFLFGIWMARSYYHTPDNTVETDSTVLIEKVREVCKLVTVEADLYEVYDENNHRNVTWYLPLPTNFTFTKKASIEVKGKVLVGYDLEKITIDVDSTNKTLVIRNLPKPEIISIEHDVKYRKLDGSFFNEFDAKDFTRINKNAKEVLREKAIEQHLLEKAKAQGTDVLGVIEFMVKGAGWNVDFNQRLFQDITKRDSIND